MTRLGWLLAAVSLWPAASVAMAQPAANEERVKKLEESLLAPCCWSEPVSVHRSETALQMRAEIASFVVQGKSDREIIDHYKKIHGARVLIEPEGAARWWVYVIPILASVLGLLAVVRVVRRLLQPSAA